MPLRLCSFKYVFDVLVHIPFVAGDDEPRCSHSIWEEASVQQDAICQVGMHVILCSCMHGILQWSLRIS